MLPDSHDLSGSTAARLSSPTTSKRRRSSFSDIVGFTTLSDTMVPEEIVEMLDVLFSPLRRAGERHG